MATEGEAESLESRLSVEDYAKMRRLFQMPDGASVPVSRAEFVELFHSVIGRGSRGEYAHLFDTVDVSRDGWVDWDRLASYLLLGLSEKGEQDMLTTVPRWSLPSSLPALHREPIQSLVRQGNGRYLSMSKEGTLGVWAENLVLLKNHMIYNDSVKPKDLWVTGMVVLPNVHKLAVSFTSKEICFYDLLSKQEFSCQYKVHGLSHTPICLHYWCSPETPQVGVLSFGDVAGQVSAVCFRSALISLFERPSSGVEQNGVINISWSELKQNRHSCCYTLKHSGHRTQWVRNVRFLGPLDALVSCSASSQNSMVLAWRESATPRLRTTAFHTEEGIVALDFHPGLNLIATAGLNSQVCLWNPYLVNKPVGVLQGHVTSVLAVQFMKDKKLLISFSKDKVLRVWDVSTQLCIQCLAGLFPKSPDCKTLLFFHEERRRLFLTLDGALFFLDLMKEERKRTTSHLGAVTCVLYSSLSGQVISGDATSAVTFWLVDTGQRVKHFSRCHGDAEITTMALDESQTRLFTAGSDGLVKVWDFNGHCHHTLNAGGDGTVEITQILLLKRTVLLLGWDRMISVFRRNSFSKYSVQRSKWRGGAQHSDDILSAAFHPPQTLVTGSRDGEIIVWNNSTENALRRLSVNTQHQNLKLSSDSSAETSSGNPPSVQTGATWHEDVPESVTRLAFLKGREEAAASGGADLVSCGGSGLVRFWNTTNARLVSEFVAHKDSSSIVMTVDDRGWYLITANVGGALKVWDVQEYCLHPSESITNQAPKLLSRLRPHGDKVTHLESCVHDGRLFLLSASVDCSVALSFLPGPTVGTFGQKVHWNLSGEFRNLEQEPEPDLSESEPEPDLEEPRQVPDDGAHGEEELEPALLQRSELTGRGHQQGSITQYQHNNGLPKSSTGKFRELRLKELASLEEMSKPDFIINPHSYFGKTWNSSAPTPPALPVTRQPGKKAAFNEKNLFPKDVLEQVDKSHRYTTKSILMKNYQRAIRSMGKFGGKKTN